MSKLVELDSDYQLLYEQLSDNGKLALQRVRTIRLAKRKYGVEAIHLFVSDVKEEQ